MREAKFTKSLTVAVPVDDYQKIKQITDDEKISIGFILKEEATTIVNRMMPSFKHRQFV